MQDEKWWRDTYLLSQEQANFMVKLLQFNPKIKGAEQRVIDKLKQEGIEAARNLASSLLKT